MFLRAPYNYDAMKASDESGLVCDPAESVVQQQFKDECDINTIVERFGISGELPSNIRMPVSGDFTKVGDFQSAMNMVRQAREAFDELPGQVRQRFFDDPQRLIEFLEDPDNRGEAVKLGLVNPPPVPQPPPSPPAPSVKAET